MNWQMERFQELDSTQARLRQEALYLPEGRVLVAARQTAGYGRNGHSWLSEMGGLYLSWLLKPAQILPDLPWVLLLSVCSVLEAQTGLSLRIKAPNDLYAGAQKLAGMLIDAQIQGERPLYYLCGLGINVNQKHFPPELQATSLYLQTGQNWSLDALLEQLLAVFAHEYQAFCADPGHWTGWQRYQDRPVQIGYNSEEIIRLGALLKHD